MASYILVTLVVVVLVETLVLGFQVPLVSGSQTQIQLQAQVNATARYWGQQLVRRYPGGVPTGTTLTRVAGPASHGTLTVPESSGPIRGGKAVTAVVVIATNGTVVTSSAPSRYPPGQAAASELPVQVGDAIGGRHGVKGGYMATSNGDVLFWMVGPGLTGPDAQSASVPGLIHDYVYVQTPWSPPGFISPIRTWGELRQLDVAGPVLLGPYALVLAIVPVGVLFGLLASGRVVRRVHRLERATLAVADGDYTITLPVSGRDELGRLEANFTAMTRQLGSAGAA